MTALAKSTEVLQRVGMPSILETIMLHKMKLRKKKEEKKENNTSHQLPKQENLGALYNFGLASEILSGISPGLPIVLKKFHCYLANLPHNFRNQSILITRERVIAMRA